MRSGRIFRSFVLLLAISATLLVSTVAASPAHFHKKDLGTCDVCSIAHLPVVEPSQTAQIFAPGISNVRIAAQAVSRPIEPFVQSESSRGPPAALAIFG